MSTRRTDDGTYPNVEEELEKLEARARAVDDVPGPYAAVAELERQGRAAREPIDAEHDDAPSSSSAPPAASDGDDDEEDLERPTRRAEVRVEAVDWLADIDETTEWIVIALEEYEDGRRHVVISAVGVDENGVDTEFVRFPASAIFHAIDRLRAFGADPNPPRERTMGDVHAALEELIADAGPAIVRALGISPLRPVPGGKK